MSNPIPPYRIGAEERVRYRVTPDTRFRHALGLDQRVRTNVSRQISGSSSISTINENYTVIVNELRYPGGNQDATEVPVGSWAYIFDAAAQGCVAEARRAENPRNEVGDRPIYSDDNEDSTQRELGRWEYRVDGVTAESQGTGVSYPLTSSIGVELRQSVDAQSTDFWVFLAPFRLSRKGLGFLLDDLKNNGTGTNSPLVRARPTSTSTLVAWVPEPFRWSASANHEWFWELGDRYIKWLQDEDRMNELFIAKTLKGWIRNGLDQVKNNLRSGQPNKYIRSFEGREAQMRGEAEVAVAYVIQCIDTPEHWAVAVSGMENGGQSLSEVYQQWGFVIKGFIATYPGRQYLDRLVQQTERFPHRYLFAAKPPDNDLDFGHYRYAYIGFKETMAELVGPWITGKLKVATGAAAGKARLAAIEKTGEEILGLLNSRLEKNGVKGLVGTYRTIYRNLAAGKTPSHGTKKGPYRGRVFRSFKKLSAKIGAAAPADEASQIVTSMDTKIEGTSQWFGRLTTPIGAVFEIINLTNAIEAYRAANPEDKGEKAYSLIGASADLATFASAVAASFAEKRAASAGARQGARVGLTGALTGIGGGFAAIAGVCEMRDQIASGVDAGYGRNNVASGLGAGFAAAGAGMTAVAGGMAAAWAFSGGVIFASAAGGPIGVVIGVIGAVIICIGAFIATIFARDPYEQFAEHCFLGDSADHEDGIHYQWAASRLPTSSRKNEAQVLLGMIGAFGLEMKGSYHTFETVPDGPCNTIVFRPGYFPRDAELYVRFKQVYAGRTYVGTATFSDSSESLHYSGMEGLQHDDRYTKIERDEQGRVTKISFTTRPQSVYDGIRTYSFPDQFVDARRLESNKVYVRLKLGIGSIHVPPGIWLELDLKEDRKVSSFESDHYG